MILSRTTLFQSPSTTTSSQSQPKETTSAPWSFTTSLPISYRVAIFLDASILLLTLAILIGAILYLRNRRPTAYMLNNARNHNLSPNPKARILKIGKGPDEEQTLLSDERGYCDVSPTREMGEVLQVSVERVVGSIVTVAGEKKKKKGHVRWTPSVQGGEAFGISEGINGKGKRREDGLNCNCGGMMHPGCRVSERKSGGSREAAGERKERANRPKGY